MENLFEGTVIEEGSPRTDRQQDKQAATEEFNRLLAAEGLSPDNREVILYAPTWKGESYFSPFTDASSLQHIIKKIESELDPSRFRVMLKAHQVVSDVVSEIPSLKNNVIPNSVPTNVALGASSYLITDYSSIFFDFLSTKRPILFYIPDLQEYRKYRDLYLEPEDLPGPVSQNADDLIVALHEAISSPEMELSASTQYANLTEKFTVNDDGGVCDRVIDSIFLGRTSSHRNTELRSSSKIKLLIYVGGMIPNGITTSALNLLDNIDYEKYDVTVLCPFSTGEMQQRSFRQVNPNARLVFRFGTFNSSYIDNLLRLRILRKGSASFGASFKSQERLWKSEWRRCFGDAKFDHIIDFSGYTSFWGTLFLHGPAKSRAIWMHNDLAADAHRSIAGNMPLKSGLFSTFSLYAKFDRLVSVSQGLAEINALSLEKWADYSKFTWSSNTINPAKIRKMASGNGNAVGASARGDQLVRSRNMGKLVTAIIDQKRPAQYRSSGIDSSEDVSPAFFTFFSAGRLSPEKNHSRLIDAFGMVHEKIPQTRLVIAGDGPLRAELQSQITSMGLRESVKLVGHTSNPFKLMANSDVFVLSSDYEGQPMVLLEALVLGLPVITTSFGSVKGALPANVGTIVDKNAGSLAKAMYEHTIDNIVYEPFDSLEYNERAMNEFYKLFG
ncbi:CDP-glycerol glycerophosphotransferase family protein [Glutamicibacter sp. AOP5-A2-18]|uniref:CDP-glycerol glycerophosphotransferase family protein n=1 Tax=Glutamicibacter sp. AOP5-A2-18 TaxID=3457656 RepID=UPI0040338349